MKTAIYIVFLFMVILIASCSESDLVAQRVYNYPERINSIVMKELDSQYNQSIEILTIDVFHPAFTQIEPKWKEYIDSNEYHIYIKARNNSKIEFCSINMDRYYKIYSFRKGRSWPAKVVEKRHRVQEGLTKKP